MKRPRRRKQLAKAEMLMSLALTVERWRREFIGAEPGSLPPDEWPSHDPMVKLATYYKLSWPEMAEVAIEIGEELERRALRCGYEDLWT